MKLTWMLSAIMAATLVLAPGCSDEGGGGTKRPAPPAAEVIDTSNAVLAQKTSFSEDDIRHFLNRTHFGIRQEDVDLIQEMGLSAYLDERLNFHLAANVEYTALTEIPDQRFPEYDDVSRWWLHIMARTENPLQEAVALFWHDHFGVSQEVLAAQNRYYILNFIKLLRAGGAGNLRDFLFDVSTAPAMLEFLDGVRSPRRSPNENFAREFWELYTLGVDNGYTQDDIVEAARAFTGFRSRTDVPQNQYFIEYDIDRHDTGDKSFFGRTLTGRSGTDGVNEYMDVIDITLEERPAAEFICRKIFEWFCYVNPPQTLVDEMAAQLRADNYELAPLLKTLFMSAAFYSDEGKAGIVKSPIDLVIGFIRTTELEYEMGTISWRVQLAGQHPCLPPSVNGWPTGRLWLSADSMIQRANALQSSIVYRDYQEINGFSVERMLPPGDSPTALGVVDHIATLMRIQLTNPEAATCAQYLNTSRDANGVETADPFDASNPDHVDERVRGLLWILGQHPSYQVR